jgi:hypothetical protein
MVNAGGQKKVEWESEKKKKKGLESATEMEIK